MDFQQKISKNKNKSLIGTACNVLIEDYDEEKKVYFGRSMRFAPEVDGSIIVHSKKPLQMNTFVQVKITDATEYDLIGKQV